MRVSALNLDFCSASKLSSWYRFPLFPALDGRYGAHTKSLQQKYCMYSYHSSDEESSGEQTSEKESCSEESSEEDSFTRGSHSGETSSR